jgi:hypothetical protein
VTDCDFNAALAGMIIALPRDASTRVNLSGAYPWTLPRIRQKRPRAAVQNARQAAALMTGGTAPSKEAAAQKGHL